MTNPTSRKPRAASASDAQNASSAAAVQPDEESPVLRITAKVAGFRRCGIAHPDTPTGYPAGRFTEAEILRLEAEPMLVVQRLAASAAEAEPSDSAATDTPDALGASNTSKGE